MDLLLFLIVALITLCIWGSSFNNVRLSWAIEIEGFDEW